MSKIHKIVGGSEVTLTSVMGSDLSVVNAAKVSFHKEATEWTDDHARLLEYLAKHNHWSPFAHCFVQWRVKAPIFVARQLVKHQVGLVWNEVSRRYVRTEPEFYDPIDWRANPVDGAKQGSHGRVDNQKACTEILDSAVKNAVDDYQELLEYGVAPEQARMVLPQNMMTEWIWSGSLYAFARVCKLRLDPHAQKESRDIAEVFYLELVNKFPYSWNYLMEYMKS